MASEEEQKMDGAGKGFAGLSSMVSDVDAAVTHAEKERPEPTPNDAPAGGGRLAPQPASEPEPSHEPYQQAAQSAGGSSAGKWLLGIGAVIGLIWLLSESGNKSTPSAPTYYPSTQPPSRPTEDKPPVGANNVLTTPQIRYCLAEDIRLDAAKGVVNNYIDSDVDRFNAMVADYNSRCGEFRYRRGSLESARSEVERNRSLLQSEGRTRFERSPSVSARQARPESSRPQPDATVHAVQRRLNELGYDVGVADGLAGAKTGSAISAFQRDQNLSVDGVASVALLERANSVERRVQSSPSIRLTGPERESIEAACSTDKYVNGAAAYRACVDRQVASLRGSVRRPDLSALSNGERQSIEAACSIDKYVNGPAAYNRCLRNQLAALTPQNRRPDLSRLTSVERQSIEAACSTDKYVYGPAAYNNCLSSQLRALDRKGFRPDLSRLTASERQTIESACSTDKYVNGPAAYNSCLSRQLSLLRN